MSDEIEEFDGPPLPDEARQEPWEITDESKAAWAVDKVLAARERLGRIKAACQAMVEQAEREVADTEAFFLPQLEAWARANPPRKSKTIKLMTGSLAFRTVPGGPRVVDEGQCTDWAKRYCPDAIKVVERLSVTAIKDYIANYGELPPGVEIAPDSERFDVKGARQ